MSIDNERNVEKGSSSTEIRQYLVDTAVGFLNMEKIKMQPEVTKRKFLEKKGLTKEEIDIAFTQSEQLVEGTCDEVTTKSYNSGKLVTSLPSPITSPFMPPRTLWSVFRDSINMLIYSYGLFLGVRYLYKHYIGPYLSGKAYKSKEANIIEIQESVMEVLKNIEKTMENINKNILIHNEKCKESDSCEKFEPPYVDSIKTELSTLKSLLINKKTFPASPAFSHAIPEWQKLNTRTSKETDAVGNENEAIDTHT